MGKRKRKKTDVVFHVGDVVLVQYGYYTGRIGEVVETYPELRYAVLKVIKDERYPSVYIEMKRAYNSLKKAEFCELKYKGCTEYANTSIRVDGKSTKVCARCKSTFEYEVLDKLLEVQD